jgi:hypothetical protein
MESGRPYLRSSQSHRRGLRDLSSVIQGRSRASLPYKCMERRLSLEERVEVPAWTWFQFGIPISEMPRPRNGWKYQELPPSLCLVPRGRARARLQPKRCKLCKSKFVGYQELTLYFTLINAS